MNIQGIFDMPAIKAIEVKILDVVTLEECCHKDEGTAIIRRLLEIRKELLDQTFVMTQEYKRLLSEFNESLIKALLEMRRRLLLLRNTTSNQESGTVEYWGKVFLDYTYPKKHPAQNMRAKKMWKLLSGTHDSYMLLYDNDGVTNLYLCDNEDMPSENQLLYLSDKVDNWNEHLDRDMTIDTHLCYAFHNLYDHTLFSIFDLLWVREFHIEIGCEVSINPVTDEEENIDWKKFDYH